MPFSFQHKGNTVRVSLKDVFKSSKELKEDLNAIARRRAAIADKNALIETILKQQEKEVEEVVKKGESQEGNNATGNANANANASGGGEEIPDGQVVKAGPMQTWVPPGQQNQSQNGNGNGNENKDKGKGNAAGGAPNAGKAWTDAQDAELRRMKDANSQWKTIATELGRHVHEVKTRWGQIKPVEERREKKGKKREEEKPEPPKEESSKGGTEEAKKVEKKKKKQPEPDPDFTVAELILLNQLAAKYEDDKWLRISSRFFDKTGKRLSPQEAKARVESWS